ncbi:MAG: hypothetical protein QOD35_802 [Nocardioidaceae bacterium]|nr:hypothetical protein [Nocardioidaceae bacterium]
MSGSVRLPKVVALWAVLAGLRCRVREDGAKRRPQRTLAPEARLIQYRNS